MAPRVEKPPVSDENNESLPFAITDVLDAIHREDVADDEAIKRIPNKPPIALFAPGIRRYHFIGDGPAEHPFTSLFGFNSAGLSVRSLEFVAVEVIRPFMEIKWLREQPGIEWDKRKHRLKVRDDVDVAGAFVEVWSSVRRVPARCEGRRFSAGDHSKAETRLPSESRPRCGVRLEGFTADG